MTIRKRISFTGKPYVGANALVLDECAFDIGTRVIKWWEKEGFSQYDLNRVVITKENMDTGEVKRRVISGKRYKDRRGGVAGIRQILVHHSGADRADPGIMREVLHNQRGLSVPFATEDDGRIYQFLDAVVAAKHAGKHNQLSVGNECCLWPDAKKRPNYYSAANRKRTGNLPHKKKEVVIQGMKKEVFCFPAEQVDAVARWAAGLWLAIGILAGKSIKGDYKMGSGMTVPLESAYQIPPKFPHSSVNGEIPNRYYRRHLDHVGVIGHLHCSKRKWDPAGFPWEEAEQLIRDYFWEFAGNYSN